MTWPHAVFLERMEEWREIYQNFLETGEVYLSASSMPEHVQQAQDMSSLSLVSTASFPLPAFFNLDTMFQQDQVIGVSHVYLSFLKYGFDIKRSLQVLLRFPCFCMYFST